MNAKSKPQTPGEVTSEPDAPAVLVTQSQLDALIAQNNELMRKLEAAGKPRVRNASDDAALPDQSSIDISLLKSPVLTKQGWLVPPEFGTHKQAPK